MNKKQNQLATPTEQRQEQERQTNEALLAEDAVQTTAYLANAPDCCSGASSWIMCSECSAPMSWMTASTTARISIRSGTIIPDPVLSL